MVEHLESIILIFDLLKDEASCDMLGYDQWPTFFLYYKLDICKLFHQAHNDDLPELNAL